MVHNFFYLNQVILFIKLLKTNVENSGKLLKISKKLKKDKEVKKWQE